MHFLKCISLFSFTLFQSSIFAAPPAIPREVLEAIPQDIRIFSKEQSAPRKKIRELIKQCGPGVFVGAGGDRALELENRCDYEVKLDELFFEADENKTGLITDNDWMYRDGTQWFVPKSLDVPADFDLRDLMKNGQPEIKKQQCGDCWAWSTHHGLEIARAVHDGLVLDLSIQTVLSCSRAGSCSGGYMKAVDFLLHGLPEESVFPYAASDKSCKFNSTQISSGWDGKIQSAPYIGDSMRYSLAKRGRDGSFREGTKVQEMAAAIYEWKSPLVVTVDAYDISGGGIYNSCSAINSGGNHMVTVVGWDSANGKRNAHVWNSWGKGHGENGVSRIQWECGNGKLNRGLGVSAKIVQYRPPCLPPVASQTYLHEIKLGDSVQLGVAQASNSTCKWVPSEGLDNPSSCTPTAKPTRSIEYHYTVENSCGTASSMTMVDVWGARNSAGRVLTPFGEVAYQRKK